MHWYFCTIITCVFSPVTKASLLLLDNKGGLIFKAGGSNMQHVTSLSFLLLAYSNYLSHANKVVPCGETTATPALLKHLAKRQVRIDFFSNLNPYYYCYYYYHFSTTWVPTL